MKDSNSSDISSLATSLGMNTLNYINISEREEQLDFLSSWPVFKEIIDKLDREKSDTSSNRDHRLVITR